MPPIFLFSLRPPPFSAARLRPVAAHGPTRPLLLPLVSVPLSLPSLPLLTSLSSPRRESCSTCQAAPRVVSSHPAINSLFHSQGYDKVIMHGPCAAPAHARTCARACTRSTPVALMEVDITFPLNIPWMSSIRESWQPSAPPPPRLICLFAFNQCQRKDAEMVEQGRRRGEERRAREGKAPLNV